MNFPALIVVMVAGRIQFEGLWSESELVRSDASGSVLSDQEQHLTFPCRLVANRIRGSLTDVLTDRTSRSLTQTSCSLFAHLRNLATLQLCDPLADCFSQPACIRLAN